VLRWQDAPAAWESHPQADHLIPLMVALGAAELEEGERIYFNTTFVGGITSSSYRFGRTH
jgi:aromatic ring-opening dioxygenase catalytic subunit (LigB family)